MKRGAYKNIFEMVMLTVNKESLFIKKGIKTTVFFMAVKKQSENKRWFYNIIGKRKHVETFDVEIKKLKNGKARHMNIKISKIKKGTFI